MKKAVCTAGFICMLLCFTGCNAIKDADGSTDNASGSVADIENGKKAVESLLQQHFGKNNVTERMLYADWNNDSANVYCINRRVVC